VPDAARARLLEALPTLGYIGNPLDPWGATDAPTAYRAAFEEFAASGVYDVLVLVHDFPYRSLPSEVETAREVTAELLRATADRPAILPVYVSLTSGEPPPETKRQLDDAGGVPLLRGAMEAFRAIAHLAAWEARRDRRPADGPVRAGWPALARDRTPWGHEPAPPAAEAPLPAVVLAERESVGLLAAAGLPVVEARPAADVAAAVAAARDLARPVALKLDAADLPHKTEVGGLRLGLVGDDAVRGAAEELLAIGRRLEAEGRATVRGLLVEPMAGPGVELIAGLERDPQFGPIVIVGLGGVLAEVLDDISLRLAPVTHDEALEMLAELHGAAILDGVRGRPAADRDAVAAMLVALGMLATQRPEIREIDLNPVVAGPAGAVAVDALVVADRRP